MTWFRQGATFFRRALPWSGLGGQKYFNGERGKRTFERQKYTKYNKINNNSENFSGSKIAARGCFTPLALP